MNFHISIVLTFIFRYNDSGIIYSTKVTKVNRKHREQTRTLAVSKSRIFFLKSAASKVTRIIDINQISGASVSPYADNYMVLHVKGEYDYVLISDKKSEILGVIGVQYTNVTRSSLDINVDTSIAYSLKTTGEQGLFFSKDTDLKGRVKKASTQDSLNIIVGEF